MINSRAVPAICVCCKYNVPNSSSQMFRGGRCCLVIANKFKCVLHRDFPANLRLWRGIILYLGKCCIYHEYKMFRVVNWKGLGQKVFYCRSGLLAFVQRDWGEPWQTLVRMSVSWPGFKLGTSWIEVFQNQVYLVKAELKFSFS